MTLEEAKKKVKAMAGKKGKKDPRKGSAAYHEVPGGKKDVFLPKGKEFKTQGDYDSPDKVAKAIAASIGYKHLGAAEMKKRQQAGRKKGKGKKESIELLLARIHEAKKAAAKKGKKDPRKGSGDYYEVPGGKKDVYLKKGKDFKTQGDYDTPKKVAGAIAAAIGYKRLGAAEMKKRQAAGRKKGGKGKKESAFETAGRMIELVAEGHDPFETIAETGAHPFE